MTARLSVASRRRPLILPRLPTSIIPVRLPTYLYLALTLLALTALVAAGWVVLVRQPVQPSNPFLAYAEIFPGQTRSTLIDTEFSCTTDPYYSLDYSLKHNEYCSHVLKHDPFWLISATLKNGMVQRTDFMVRKGTLTLGDLMFLWGRPTVHLHHGTARFEWRQLGISAIGWAENRQFSYYIPVTRLSISLSRKQQL